MITLTGSLTLRHTPLLALPCCTTALVTSLSVIRIREARKLLAPLKTTLRRLELLPYFRKLYTRALQTAAQHSRFPHRCF